MNQLQFFSLVFLIFFAPYSTPLKSKNKLLQSNLLSLTKLGFPEVDADKLISKAESTMLKPFTQLLGDAMSKSLKTCFPQTINLIAFDSGFNEFLSDFPFILKEDAKEKTKCIISAIKNNMGGGLAVIPGILFNIKFASIVDKSIDGCDTKETGEKMKKAFKIKFYPFVGTILDFPYSGFKCYLGNLEKKANEEQKLDPESQKYIDNIKKMYKEKEIEFNSFITSKKEIEVKKVNNVEKVFSDKSDYQSLDNGMQNINVIKEPKQNDLKNGPMDDIPEEESGPLQCDDLLLK